MNRTHALLIAAAVLVFGVAGIARYLPRTGPVPATVGAGSVSPSENGTPGETINRDIPSQAAAVVSEATGTTAVVRGGTRLSVVAGMRLVTDDRIEVGEDGGLAVVWPHYGRTLLASGTVLVLREAFESTDRETIRIRLGLEQGRIWTRLQRQLGYGSLFHVRAADVLVMADSASFGVTRDDGSRIQVLQSSVRVTRVRDRPALAGEIVRGYPYPTVEEPSGTAVTVAETEEVTVASAGPVPKPRRADAEPAPDPFVADGDAVIPVEVLAAEPAEDPSESS